MEYRKEIERELYPSAMAVFLGAGIVSLLCSVMGVGQHAAVTMGAAAAASCLLYLGGKNRDKLLPAGIITGILLIAAILISGKGGRTFLSSYLDWWKGVLGGYPQEKEGYEILSTILLAFLFTAAAYALQQWYFIRLGTALLLLSALVVIGLSDYQSERVCVTMFLVFILLTLIEFVFRIIYPSEQKKYKSALAYLVPVGCIFALLLTTLPYSENPYQWTILRRMWGQVQKVVQEISLNIRLMSMGSSEDAEEFTVRFIGYSDSGDIGGDIGTEKKAVMTMRMQGRPKTAIYLGGNTKDTYTGDGWEQSSGNVVPEGESDWDTLELIYAMWRAQIKNFNPSIMKIQRFDITYKDILTQTLFSPLKLVDLSADSTTKDSAVGWNSIRFNKFKTEGETYGVRFLELNLAEQKTQDFIRSEETFRYDGTLLLEDKRLGMVLRNMGVYLDVPEEIGQGLFERAEGIRGQYLGLPENLPERIGVLAHEITKDYTGSYDKLRALETYIGSFKYTISPGEIPEGRDAVDYFLFDTQEGYCTYFASAMTVMSRCIGIPSRYVQGFMTRSSGEVFYEVQSRDAHAWTECYLEGVGWLPFEPTSGYQKTRYLPWEFQVVAGTGQIIDDSALKYQQAQLEIEKKEQEAAAAAVLNIKLKKQVYGYLAWFIIGICVLTGLGVYCSIWASKRRYRIRYQNGSPERRLEIETRHLFLLWDRLGYKLQDGETFRGYTTRLLPGFPEQQKELKQYAELYMGCRYGGREVQEEELSPARTLRQQMQELVKEQTGRIRFLFENAAVIRKVSGKDEKKK